MQRQAAMLLLATALLAGCDDSGKSSAGGQYATAQPDAAASPVVEQAVAGDKLALGSFGQDGIDSRTKSGESYTYDHDMTLSMASAFIKGRFERARDRCQNDPALKCRVVSASFRVLGEPDAPLPVANLSVSLPHDAVALFEDSLLTALPNESVGDVMIQSRSTTAQNVTNQVRDMEGRLSQLTNYRDRMTELSKRPKSSTDDLIKIEGEISRTQSEIEQLEGQRRDLADRIAKENLTISFQAQSTTSDALQPVAEVWQSSVRLLAQSAAAALALVIGILPWLPIFALGFYLVRLLWRRARRKPA
ncbi:MAG: DUF4349 domain-containing protein [Alphaproteobacteria bacterium]|nr:DUF4349 domain-containing protein [Alphaproteobacteria bacterium]